MGDGRFRSRGPQKNELSPAIDTMGTALLVGACVEWKKLIE